MPKARRGSSVITKIISGETLKKIKKFGFGSNLVDFTTPTTVPSNTVAEAIAPPNNGEAYRNMFDPAYNVWNKGEWESDDRKFVINISSKEGERITKGNASKVSDAFVPVPDARNLHDQFYDHVGLLLDSQLLDKSSFGNRVTNGYSFFRAVVLEEENHRSAKFRNYYSLDGKGKRLEINDFSRNNDWGSEFFTFEMWIRPERKNQAGDSGNPTHTLLDMRLEGNRRPVATRPGYPVIQLYDNGNVVLNFYTTSNVNVVAPGVVFDEWNHIAVQRHDGDISIYVNGVKKITTTYTGTFSANGNFFIGHIVGSGSNITNMSVGFKGDIALVRNTPGVARYANLDSFNADATITTFNVPPLNPNSISGLKMWLDANDRTSIKDTAFGVEFWGDKSGNENHLVQTNIGLRPHLQYNESVEKPTMRFSGTRDRSRDDPREPYIQNGDYLECETDIFSIPTGSGDDGKAARTSIFIVFKTLSGLEEARSDSKGRELAPRVIGYEHAVLSLLNTGTIPITDGAGNSSIKFDNSYWSLIDTVQAYGSSGINSYMINRKDDFRQSPRRITRSTTDRSSSDKYKVIEIEWGGDQYDSSQGSFDYFRSEEKIKWGPLYVRTGHLNRNPHSYDKFVVGSQLRAIEEGYSADKKIQNGMVGNVAEILVYKGGVSEIDKKNIRNYLNDKWEAV